MRERQTTGYAAANLRATEAPVPGPTPAMMAYGDMMGWRWLRRDSRREEGCMRRDEGGGVYKGLSGSRLVGLIIHGVIDD